MTHAAQLDSAIAIQPSRAFRLDRFLPNACAENVAQTDQPHRSKGARLFDHLLSIPSNVGSL